jgi:predicted permease
VAGDLVAALKSLRAAPITAAAAILVLALGSGATTAVLSAAYAALLRPLPFADADRLVTISPGDAVRRPDLDRWRDRSRAVDAIAAWSRSSFTVRGLPVPEALDVAVVSENFFQVLGARPAAGRLDLDVPGGAVLSSRFARRLAADDASLWTRALTVGGRAVTPRGVLAPEFPLPDDVDLWISIADVDEVRLGTGDFRAFSLIGRLAPGASIAQARDDAARVAAEIDAVDGRIAPRVVEVRPIRDVIAGDTQPVFAAFAVAALMLLLAACANAATLLVSRTMQRTREFAVRLALGASPSRIVRTMLAESLFLGITGALVGVGLAQAAIRLLQPLAADVLPDTAFVSLTLPASVAGVAAAIVVAIPCGAAPAVAAARSGFGGGLKTASAAGTRSSRRLRSGLVVLQMATAVFLLVGAGLLWRTVAGLVSTDLGIDGERTLTMRLPLTETTSFNAASSGPFVDGLLTRLRGLPGVEAAGLGSNLPPRSSQLVMTINVTTTEGARDMRPLDLTSVTPGYLEALGARLVRGRLFDARDRAATEPVAILSESAAQQISVLGDPLDRPLRYGLPSAGGKRVQPRVIGVVSDVRFSGLEASPRGNIYILRSQLPTGVAFLVVKATTPADTMAPAVLRTVRDLDPAMPVTAPITLEEEVQRSVVGRRLRVVLVGGFAVVAAVLAFAGLSGALIRAVTERRRELAIRSALGAGPRQTASLIMRDAFVLAVVGVAIGVGGAIAAGRWVQAFLYGVSAFDAATIATVGAGSLAVAIAVASVPALRAATVDPVEALKE